MAAMPPAKDSKETIAQSSDAKPAEPTLSIAETPTDAATGAFRADGSETRPDPRTTTPTQSIPGAPVKLPIAMDQTVDALSPTREVAAADFTVDHACDATEAMTHAQPGVLLEETLPHGFEETRDMRATLDATVEAPAQRALRGKQSTPPVLGRYRLKRFHARGGMGEILVAEDTVIGRTVALKRMLTNRPDQVYRFRVEAQVTGQLEHPGIAPVHELAADEHGRPYYVMKFVRGETLKKVIEKFHSAKHDAGAREIEQSRLLQMMISLCQTVAYAHSRGVLHRDLKPDNVMLGPFGETILLDWGIARVIGSDSSDAESDEPRYARVDAPEAGTETVEGAITGTPAYMPPEVAAGLNREVDFRSDVFLLGAILYEIITGKQPRSAKSLQELLHKAQFEQPAAARTIDPMITRTLEAICLKATALDKLARYQTALELADDLQRYIAGEPVTAYPEGPLERAWRWARRHRVALTRAVAAVVLLGLGTFAAVKVRQAERIATRLRKNDQARRDLKSFRQLAQEANFYAATTDPLAENAPYFDPHKGEAAARAALALTKAWGPSLGALPIAEEREPARREVYELDLLLAHLLLSQPSADTARSALTLLDQVHALHASTLGETRLKDKAARALGKAGNSAPVSAIEPASDMGTAQDHFLLGEEYRVQAFRKKDPKAERAVWQRDPTLLDKAIVEYRTSLALDPAQYWARFQLGRSYLSQGKLAEAVEALGACTALKPESPWAFSVRGLALAQMKRYDEATADFDHSLRIDPAALPVRLNRGYVHWIRKELDLALADFNAVLQAPKSQRLVQAAYYRGHINAAQGKVQEALDDFTLVIAEDPGFAPAYKPRALVYFMRGDDAAGMQDLDTASLAEGRDPNGPEWHLHGNRGHLLRSLHGELPSEKRSGPFGQSLARRAVTELRLAISLGGRAWELFDDLGAILELQGRGADALAPYGQGLEIAPENVKLRIKRGWLLIGAGRNEPAALDFRAAIKVEPRNAEAHSGLGFAQAMLNHPLEAQREAEIALLHGSDNFVTLHNIACIYAALSRNAGPEATPSQQLTLELLRKALVVWKTTDTPLNEVALIRGDTAFQSLHDQPEFQKLLNPD
jgi:tetratricopeptide (TPR) repeat protein